MHEFQAETVGRPLQALEFGSIVARMRKIASAAIQEFGLGYTVTLVSSGASKNFEIVT